MTAVELVSELARRGARIERSAGRVLIRPRAAVLDLEPALRARAKDLLALAGRDIDGATPETHAQNAPVLNGPSDGDGSEHSVHASGEPALRERPVPVPRERADETLRLPLRVGVDEIAPRPSPFDLSPGVRVIDTVRCIGADLAELHATVAEYSRVWAGPDESTSLARALRERIETLLDRLAASGAKVRVEAVQ